MPDVYSDIATIQNAPHVGDSLNSATKEAGKVRTVLAEYEAASVAIAAVIAICKLRKGDIVLSKSNMKSDALGASSTIAVGDDDDTDAADDARYLAATSTVSAASTNFDAVANIDKMPYVIQKDCWLAAVVAGAAITGTLKFEILIARFGG